MRYLLVLLLALSPLTFAIDMPADSEQFYVTQDVFNKLNITREACEQQDAVINFACGQYIGGVTTFKTALADYIRLELPGLTLEKDWFENLGGVAIDYRSDKGQYLFGYNPGGLVIVAFVPN